MHELRAETDILNKRMEENGEFFRMEKTFMRSANDPMAARMRGVTHSSSMLNANALYLMRHFGYGAASHSARFWGSTEITNDLFGFRYILHGYHTEGGTRQNHHSLVRIIDVEDNEDALPLAYLVDPRTKAFVMEPDDVFGNQSRLLANMLGDRDNPYFVRIKPIIKNPERLDEQTHYVGYLAYERTKGFEHYDAHIQYTLEADEAGDFYLYFPTGYEYRLNIWLQRYHDDGEPNGGPLSLGHMYEGEHHHIHHIGEMYKGERFMVTISLPGGSNQMFFREEIFVRLDHELVAADVARIHQMNANTTFTAVNDTHLKITTNQAEERLLFTSIPLEPGWRAYINGREVPIEGVIHWTKSEPKEPMGVFDRIADYFKQLLNIAEKDAHGNKLVDEHGKRKPPVVDRHDVDKWGFVSVNVPAGEHTIELKFFPDKMPEGIALSIVGLAGFLLLIVLMSMLAERQKEAAKAIAAKSAKAVFVPKKSKKSAKASAKPDEVPENKEIKDDDISVALAEIGLAVETEVEEKEDSVGKYEGVVDVYDGFDSDYERD